MSTPSLMMFARLHYGSSFAPVERGPHMPLPAEFDFNNVESCARRVFALMALASGFPVKRCQLRIDPVRMTANLTANGVHVFYTPTLPKMSLDEAIAAHKRTQLFHLGDVQPPANPEGAAVWTLPENAR